MKSLFFLWRCVRGLLLELVGLVILLALVSPQLVAPLLDRIPSADSTTSGVRWQQESRFELRDERLEEHGLTERREGQFRELLIPTPPAPWPSVHASSQQAPFAPSGKNASAGRPRLQTASPAPRGGGWTESVDQMLR